MKRNVWNVFIFYANIYEECLSICVLEWKYFVPNSKSYYFYLFTYVISYLLMTVLSTVCFELWVLQSKWWCRKGKRAHRKREETLTAETLPKALGELSSHHSRHWAYFVHVILHCCFPTYTCVRSFGGWHGFFVLYMMHVFSMVHF